MGAWREQQRRSLAAARDFDRQYQVDTAEAVPLWQLDATSPSWSQGLSYSGSPVDDFRACMRGLSIAYEQFTFIDFGSGKGRALLLATEFPFRKVLGVEFVPALHHIAQENIARYRSVTGRGANCESICIDAGEYDLPQDPLVCYFFNPFRQPVMERVLSNIRRSIEQNPRPVLIVYRDPVLSHLLDRHPFLSRTGGGAQYAVYAHYPDSSRTVPTGHQSRERSSFAV